MNKPLLYVITCESEQMNRTEDAADRTLTHRDGSRGGLPGESSCRLDKVRRNTRIIAYSIIRTLVQGRVQLSLTTSMDRRESAAPVVDTKVQMKRCHRPGVFLPKIKRRDLRCFSESVGMGVWIMLEAASETAIITKAGRLLT